MALGPLPPPSIPWMDPDGKPSLTYRLYFLTLDQAIRTASIQVGTPNNANAKAAGIPVGGFYTTTADPHIVYIRTA